MKIRKAEPKDIVLGNKLLLVGDERHLFVKTVEEVLHPDDEWKAFCAEDGCRYGLRDLWVVDYFSE